MKGAQLILAGIALLNAACGGGPPVRAAAEAVSLEVVATGESAGDADVEARVMLLERGIGSVVERRSELSNGQLTYDMMSSSTEGFVTGFRRKAERTLPNGLVEVTATGTVSLKAVEAALVERLKDIGNPRLMVLMDENVFGAASVAGSSKSELELMETLGREGFRFIDREQFKKALARDKGLAVGAYGNPTAEEKALETAAQLNAEILVVGQAIIRDNGEVRAGSGLHSITADIRLKIINVGTAEILGTTIESSTTAHAVREVGVTNAVRKAILASAARLKQQVAGKWKAGGVTRVVFQGIEPEAFLSGNFSGLVRRLRGVTGVEERNDNDSGMVLEVRCFCNAFRLTKEILRRKREFGRPLTLKAIKGNTVRLAVGI
ncbi:MAG: hypothetical protein HUU38_25850 [Anaerolineales bacterium]|nr:hypothetical protein [Anaerolineales bacterium]